MNKLPLTLCVLFIAGPSLANLRVQFVEGAPKDTFIISNEGSCDIGSSELVIDFTGSSAGLIFDVTGSGAGVEVFQPFAVTEGEHLLTRLPTIADGDRSATLMIETLGVAQKIAFTIDVDDTTGDREITVSGDEIVGATVSLSAQGKQISAQMGANADVLLETGGCAY